MAVRGAVVGLLAACLLGLGASAASAVIVHLANGTTLSYQPIPGSHVGGTASGFDEFFTNLDYSGGPVMTSNTNYTIYWRPKVSPPAEYPVGFKTGVNKYFSDLEHDSGGSQNVDSVATQYNNSAGEFVQYQSKFGEGLTDENPYPSFGCTRAPKCLTDAQLRAELTKFVAEKKLPADQAHEYFLLTPEGVESCFEESVEAECSANVTELEHQTYCAYHGDIHLEGGGNIVYSNDPFVNGKHCDEPHHINGPSDSALFGGMSHEHVESITDPEPNNAWTDWGKLTGEIGDKCRTFEPASEFGTPLGKTGPENLTYNQEINGDRFWYQQEWSNKGATCLQRLKFEASEAPAAKFSFASLSGRKVEFNATGSATGANVRYVWQFNDRSGHLENKTFETTSLTFVHEFPAFSTYTVALTVYKADGTSKGVAQLVTPGKLSQTIAFISSPPGSATVGGPTYTATATATSGLPVALAIDASSGSVCSISGSTVSFVGAGTCTIDANQAGNGTYNPAPQSQQSFGVSSPPPPPVVVVPVAPVVAAAVTPTPEPEPNGSFTAGETTFNQKTGELTFTQTVSDPGTFSWLLTFQNGKFGVFSASSHKCKAGFVLLGGKCRPSKIVFARGSAVVAAPGAVTLRLKPSASALKALKNALKQKKGLPVTVTFTFQSARGGSPISHSRTMTVKLKKR
ncbi:MAG TPA: PKD domain-containing protein [Solirubrobacteraceae bacterium]|nr:PKD domain-containing protein [Solirubrobacteraceae bacterium]